MIFSPLSSMLCLLAGCIAMVAADDQDNVKKIALRTHSLGPPYLDSDLQSRWWDFGGDTIIRADRYVRLASDMPSRSGWIFSKIPLTATNWEIEFEFKIDGKGTLHADGMALWITKQRGTLGPVFGSVDHFDGLGIFFDTYKNYRPGAVYPFVMAMLGDGQTAYEKETDGTGQDLAGCSARGIRGADVPTKARVTYFQEKSLKLDLQWKSEGEWTECFETGPITLPSVAYMGFSAATGELSDNFDLISVETSNLYVTTPPAAASSSHEPEKPQNRKERLKAEKAARKAAQEAAGKAAKKAEKEISGWGWFTKLFIFVLVVGGCYGGFTVYRSSSKKYSRFD